MGGGPMRLIKMNFVPPPLISDPQAEKEPKKFRKQNSKVAGAFCISTWVGSLVVVQCVGIQDSLLLCFFGLPFFIFILKYSQQQQQQTSDLQWNTPHNFRVEGVQPQKPAKPHLPFCNIQTVYDLGPSPLPFCPHGDHREGDHNLLTNNE